MATSPSGVVITVELLYLKEKPRKSSLEDYRARRKQWIQTFKK